MIDFESYKPQIEERYKDLTRMMYLNLAERFTPQFDGKIRDAEGKIIERRESIYNSRSYSTFKSSIQPNLSSRKIERNPNIPERDWEYFLDEEKLAKNASKYADLTIQEWEGKIRGKLGQIEDGEVRHLDGFRFLIIGKKGDHDVRIEQDMIINYSGKGKAFNQFPARIYVDGKFMSEKKYKEMA